MPSEANATLDAAAAQVAEASNGEITQNEARAELDAEVAAGDLDTPPDLSFFEDPVHPLWSDQLQNVLNHCCDKKGCDRVILPDSADPFMDFMALMDQLGADGGDEADDLNDDQ